MQKLPVPREVHSSAPRSPVLHRSSALLSHGSGCAGVCTTEALQDVPLNSALRPGYNDSSDASSDGSAAAPAEALGPAPPPTSGTGKRSGYTRPAVSTGGAPWPTTCITPNLCDTAPAADMAVSLALPPTSGTASPLGTPGLRFQQVA